MVVDDKEISEVNDATIGLNDGDVDEKRGNAADRADMYRMGKVQEMRVRAGWLLGFVSLSVLTQHLIEKFSLLVHIWLFYDSNGVVGVLFKVNWGLKMLRQLGY